MYCLLVILALKALNGLNIVESIQEHETTCIMKSNTLLSKDQIHVSDQDLKGENVDPFVFFS